MEYLDNYISETFGSYYLIYESEKNCSWYFKHLLCFSFAVIITFLLFYVIYIDYFPYQVAANNSRIWDPSFQNIISFIFEIVI